MLKNIHVFLIGFFVSFAVGSLVQACQPAKDAYDYLSSQCEDELVTQSPIILEAEKRGVPAVQLVQTFCAINDIADLWRKDAKKLGGPTPAAQAIDVLRLRGEI